MTLYKKTYRAETNRLKNHAYDEGIYFVTICTRKKIQWFGEIRDKKMYLSEIGNIVREELLKTKNIRQYVRIDSWCVMPDHLHAIFQIDSEVETPPRVVSLPKSSDINILEAAYMNDSNSKINAFETRAPRVSTKTFSLKSQTLGSMINQLKGAATKKIYAKGYPVFYWQPRYYDHIIRTEEELKAIRAYIQRNPKLWDKEHIPWHADATYQSL